MAGGQEEFVELIVRSRGADNDLLDPGYLSGDNVHQEAAGIRRLAAGNVETGPIDGSDLLPQYATGGVSLHPGFGHEFLMIVTDTVVGQLKGITKFGIDRLVGRFHLIGAHFELVIALRIPPVKTGNLLSQRHVAAGTNLLEQVIDNRADPLDVHRSPTEKLVKMGLEVCVCRAKCFHLFMSLLA